MEPGNWIDRFIKKLETNTSGNENRKHELIDKLQQDLRDELILSKELEAESKRLPYPHLVTEAQQLSSAKARHAGAIARLIETLGGQINREEIDKYSPAPDGKFNEIFLVETQLGVRLAEHANWAEDNGFRHEARVLRDIKDENSDHIEKIERLIMRYNGSM